MAWLQRALRRYRILAAAIALTASTGLLWPNTSIAAPAAVATSFTIAGDTVLTIRPDFSSEKLVKVRIKVLGEAAVTAVGQQSVSFHERNQSLDVLEAYTEKSDGRKISVEPTNIITRDAASGAALILMRDLKSSTIIFPDVAVGDTVDFTYRLTTRSDVLGSYVDDVFVFPRQMPFAPTTVRLIAPKDAGLKLTVLGDDLRQETTETAESVIHHISYDPKPRIIPEPGAISPLDRDARIIVSTFKDYEELGKRWIAVAGSRTRVTPEIQALADDITKGIEDRRAQAEAIDRWVKRNIRYIAVYLDAAAGWIPHEPAEILKYRYGDCKDHATLMGALLAAKDIASEAVVINAGNIYTIPDIAARGYFNHMIIYLPEFGLYDDPTVGTAAFGVLGQGDYDKPVLRMSAEEVRLDRTPAMRPQDHVSTNFTRIAVAADGSMTGETKETGTGVFGYGMRATSTAIQHNGAEKAAENQLKANGLKGTGRFVLPASLELTDPFTITSEFKLENKLATAIGSETVIPSGLATRVRAGRYLLGNRLEERKEPFTCLAGHQIEEIDVTFAVGLPLPIVPKGRTIHNPKFTYVAQYKLDERTLKVRREFVSKVTGQVCAPEVETEVAGPLKGVLADLETKMRMPKPVVTSKVQPARPSSAEGQAPATAEPKESKPETPHARPIVTERILPPSLEELKVETAVLPKAESTLKPIEEPKPAPAQRKSGFLPL
jgi:transglutaminase-like putative cysteine protease